MASYSLLTLQSSVDNSKMEPSTAKDEEEQVDVTLASLALEEHDADGSVTKNSSPLLDEKQFQRAKQRKQLKLIAIVVSSLAMIALVATAILYAPFRSSNEGQAIVVPEEARLSACELGKDLFAGYDAKLLDYWLDIDVDRVSSVFSMSDDGSTMVMAAPEWDSAVRIIRNLGTERRSFNTLSADYLPDKITNVALSGDGAYLVASDSYDTVLMETDTGKRVPFFDPIGKYDLQQGYLGWVVTDLAINSDGTKFAIAYGTNDTSTAQYELGDGREWRWDNLTGALTVVYDRKANNGQQNDWDSSQFPMDYQTDNFGLQLDITGDGQFVFQSSEHDNRQHVMNQLAKSDSMDAWYGTMDGFPLLSNDLCTDTASDVAVSSDGTTLVLALQCLEVGGGGVTLYVYPFVALSEDMQTDDIFRAWNLTSSEPVLEMLETDALKPMSIAMSGDGSVTVITVDGVLGITFDGKWSERGSQTVHLVDGIPAEMAMQISDDASVVVFSATNTAGASVCLFTK